MNACHRITAVLICLAALVCVGCGNEVVIPITDPTPVPTPTPQPSPEQTPPAPPPTQESSPKISVSIDTGLKPAEPSLPAEDGTPRPIAVLTDKSNIPCEFVENELMIQSADAQAITDAITRLNGTIIDMINPAEFGLVGDTTVLVRLVAPKADVNAMLADLQRLAPTTGGAMRLSSDAGMDLLAAAAREANGGVKMGLNFIMQNTNARDRNVREAAGGNDLVSRDGVVREKYDPNPHNWSYMKRGGFQNFGVAEAWSILDRAGRINNRVTIGIVDGGFDPSADYPAIHTHFSASGNPNPMGANEMTCTGGSGCPWHGQNVVDACMGVMDNGRGAAGPAGPVARCITVRRNKDYWSGLQGIATAFGQGARIINMSYSARVPAAGSFTVIPSNELTDMCRNAGALLFASAGNDDQDIDAEDCFIACWEEAWHTPVENAGVIGVGAMELNATHRRGDSNYGGEELDIWGPGYMWVGPDPANGNVHGFGATSGACPFVAGVAALIWAANPALSNNQVEQIMMETCNRGSRDCHRWPDATAAVIRALGNIPPELSNVKVERTGFVGRNLQFSCDAFDVEDGVPNVVWTSDRSGVIGTGTLVGRSDLPYGRHTFTCTATDRAGVRLVETRVFELVNAPPRLSIEQPLNGTHFFAGQTAFFECYSYDIESMTRLPDPALAWSSSRDGAMGNGRLIEASLRTVGLHQVSLIGMDQDGTTSRSSIDVTVNPPPPDGVPPTAFIYLFDYDPSAARFDPVRNQYYHEISLGGVGRDVEDGPLPGSSLMWTLESDSVSWAMPPGPVYGTFVNTQIYGYGRFRVVLTVTDRSNKTGTHARTGELQVIR